MILQNKKASFQRKFSCFPKPLWFCKRAVAGEMFLTIYRLFIVTIIAFFVLGVSAFAYDYYLDVRDIEARVLARGVVNCVAPEGVVNLQRFDGKEKSFLEICEMKNLDRFYVSVIVLDNSGKEIGKLEQGDSVLLWTEEIYKKGSQIKNIEKYNPGYYLQEYSVKDRKIKVEVLISHEF